MMGATRGVRLMRISAALVSFAVLCSGAVSAQVERGRVISTSFVRSYSTDEIHNLAWELTGLPWIFYEELGFSTRYGVSLYRIVYETVGVHGGSAAASGLLIVPQMSGAAPLCSVQHGTMVEKDDAPSVKVGLEVGGGIMFATDGYVTAMPDYLGLGEESPGLHPYVHADSLASASLDMLRAARTAMRGQRAVRLNGQLFLVGYSEGGYATMGLMRELEKNGAADFTVTACAPMAGPYDISGTMRELMASDAPAREPYYFPYVFFSYDMVYDLYGSASDFLREPYAASLPPLFDGTHRGGEINDAMPSSRIPHEILKDDILEKLRNPSPGPLLDAMRDNDLYDWTPRAPMRMFHCEGDETVPFRNSQVAYDRFIARGAADLLLIDPGASLDHAGCAMPAFAGAKEWMDTFSTLVIEPGRMSAGARFSFELYLPRDIDEAFDFYCLADTQTGSYTLYLDGRAERGIEALYEDISGASAPLEITVTPDPAVPGAMAGTRVALYAVVVNAGTMPPVSSLSELTADTPNVIMLDKETVTVAP